MPCLISTAGQAAAFRQDQECRAQRAAPHAGSAAVKAGRVTWRAVWLITIGLRALKRQKNLLRRRLDVSRGLPERL